MPRLARFALAFTGALAGALAGAVAGAVPSPLQAQEAALPAAAAARPLTRDEAVRTALGQAAALGVARADTALAYAQLLTARARQNPTVSASYSRATPQYHVAADLPLDYAGLRGARTRAAEAGRRTALLRFRSARVAVALSADTAYTRALSARERLALSRRNAAAADSLQRIAVRRRDAGDASELDVELATVNAAQQANTTLSDSLALVSAVLDLQAAIGLASDGVAVAPSDPLGVPTIPSALQDSLGFTPGTPRSTAPGASAPAPRFLAPSPVDVPPARAAGTAPAASAPAGAAASTGGTSALAAAGPPAGARATAPPGAAAAAGAVPLSVAAAQASVEAARLGALVERRSVWSAPSVTAGFETGDPTGSERGILPTIGIAVPLPLLSRNRGPIVQAEAERTRAEAELTLAQVESRTEIARTRRTLAIALDKVRRDQALVAAANRVAALSATAYREGASPLPAVLEAQRNARDVLAQYVADLADAWITSASLRALTLTSDTLPR